ncbi:DUF4388 domain-containing protein [candidate division KSB1 bacterium]|nr:MAG: DUF4388 domain-containing protein [candidate division KSB1 bacterium]
MGNKRAIMGNLDVQGALPLLQSVFTDQWSGVVRVRSGHRMGTMWLVKGSIVHAILLEGQRKSEGMNAFEQITAWREGVYLLEEGVLPPERTIRVDMPILLDQLLSSDETAVQSPFPVLPNPENRNQLSVVFQTLRERVPGLESLSLTRGATVEATTVADVAERDWLHDQLQVYCHEASTVPEKLYLQQGEHTLLIIKQGTLATVLSACRGTAPEALFWAGEEARRRMLLTNDDSRETEE